MGLCKCPKRKVTTQFCYEHRVNVCEHCVVLNHPRVSIISFLNSFDLQLNFLKSYFHLNKTIFIICLFIELKKFTFSVWYSHIYFGYRIVIIVLIVFCVKKNWLLTNVLDYVVTVSYLCYFIQFYLDQDIYHDMFMKYIP